MAVSDFGGRKYSIDDAIVALSWAKSVICDLKSVIVIVRIKWNMEHWQSYQRISYSILNKLLKFVLRRSSKSSRTVFIGADGS